MGFSTPSNSSIFWRYQLDSCSLIQLQGLPGAPADPTQLSRLPPLSSPPPPAIPSDWAPCSSLFRASLKDLLGCFTDQRATFPVFSNLLKKIIKDSLGCDSELGVCLSCTRLWIQSLVHVCAFMRVRAHTHTRSQRVSIRVLSLEASVIQKFWCWGLVREGRQSSGVYLSPPALSPVP